jgi:hypothetical protein
MSAAGQEVGVGVLALGHQQFGDQGGQPGASHPQPIIDSWEGEAEDTQAFRAVQQRQPQPPARSDVSLLHRDRGKGPAGQRGADLKRRPVGAIRKRNQQHLFVVDQVDGNIIGIHGLSGPSDRSHDLVRCQVVRGFQQVTKQIHTRITHWSSLLGHWSASSAVAPRVVCRLRSRFSRLACASGT